MPFPTLAAGFWYEAPSTRLDAVAPASIPPGALGLAGIMTAYSGGAYDTKRDRLLIWGGGHGDYAGNEVYGFDARDQRWRRLTEPSVNVAGTDTDGYYDNGAGGIDTQQPRSHHTYNTLEHCPLTDRFLGFGNIFTYQLAETAKLLHRLNQDTKVWSEGALYPGAASQMGAGSWVVRNPHTGNFWFHGCGTGAVLYEYNPVADTWTAHGTSGQDDGTATATTPVIVPDQHKIYAFGNGSGLSWDMKPGTTTVKATVTTTGPQTIVDAVRPGLAWDPVAKRIVGWSGGSSVYTLNPSTLVWAEVTPAGGNTVTPSSAQGNGTHGRFRYIPNANLFIAVNRVTENVYFYKHQADPAAASPRLGYGVG